MVIVVAYRSTAGKGDTATVGPGSGARLRIPGVALDVPSGAVAATTRAHLDPATVATLHVPDQMAALFTSGGPVFTVDLSGRQPLTPLTVTITVPSGTDARRLVLLTNHGGTLGSVAVHPDGHGAVRAQLSELSGFWLAAVNPSAVLDAASKAMVPLLQLLDLRGPKPACADQPVTLPDGAVVSVQNLSAPDLLWPCLQVLADGQIQVTVHSGSGTPWRIRTTGGQYTGPAEVDPANVLVQGLYESVQQDRAHNDGLVLPRSSGSWQVSPGSLPVDMVAVVSPGAWWGQFGIFAATFVADIATRSVKVAAHLPQFVKRFSDVMGRAGCVSAILQAVPEGQNLTFDRFVALTQAEFACADTIAEILGGALNPLQAIVVDIITGAIPLLWGAVEGVLRGLLTPVRDMSSLTWSIRRSGTPGFTLPATTAASATGGGLDTGISLKQGARVHVTATGLTTYGPETGPTTGCTATGMGSVRPNGDRSVGATPCPPKIDPLCPLPSAPVGTVIARVGSGPWVLVGASGDVSATRDGDLWLGYNDWLPSDNVGTYQVDVQVPN